MLNKIYNRNGLLFAILWIVVYVVGLSIADNLSVAIGLEKSVTVIVCLLMTLLLYHWIQKNHFQQKYGLCRAIVPAGQMLYYIPLGILVSVNLWFGVAVNLSLWETIFYIISMLFVGFLEEIIFRGLLFVEMCKGNVKTAILVSSITFGIGHMVNLINGSGADLFSNLLQVAYAIAIGFLFTMIFYRTKSLWSCIITHSMVNALSVFVNEIQMTVGREIFSVAMLILIPMAYLWYIEQRCGSVKSTGKE